MENKNWIEDQGHILDIIFATNNYDKVQQNVTRKINMGNKNHTRIHRYVLKIANYKYRGTYLDIQTTIELLRRFDTTFLIRRVDSEREYLILAQYFHNRK